MFNKALLMAVGGKKKNEFGEFYSKFTVLVAEVFGGFSGVYINANENLGGEYETIDGHSLIADDGTFMFLYMDGMFLLTSPHMYDEDFRLKPHVCALVNEESQEVFYGILFTDEESGWLIMFGNYSDAKKIADDPGSLDESMEFVYPFTDADVGKRFTFSFFICD